MSFYGYERQSTPFLNKLAENETLIENCYSTSCWSVSSHASIFTGKLPSEHGCNTTKIEFDETSFVQDLSEQGFNTYSICFNPFVSPENGFDKGFDSFESNLTKKIIENKEKKLKAWKKFFGSNKETRIGRYKDFIRDCIKFRELDSFLLSLKYFINGKSLGLQTKKGDELTAQIIESKINEGKIEEPFFLFVNLMGAHNPDQSGAKEDIYEWINPEKINCKTRGFQKKNNECTRKEIAKYDAALRFVDSKIKRIIKAVESNFDENSIVITSDHGENFGEREVLDNHALWGHQYALTDETVKVPMIISDPDIEEDNIEQNFSLVNLREFFLEEEIVTRREEPIYAEYHGLSDSLEASIKDTLINMLRVTDLSKVYEVIEGIREPNTIKKFYSNKSFLAREKEKQLIYNTEFENFGDNSLSHLLSKYIKEY